MRVIVAGSRDFEDEELLFRTLDKSFGHCLDKVTIISGAARGADRLGEKWAKQRGVKLESFPAQWDKYGNAAGPIRNTEMAETSTHALIFWDGSSRGSAHMRDVGLQMGLWVRVIYYLKEGQNG